MSRISPLAPQNFVLTLLLAALCWGCGGSNADPGPVLAAGAGTLVYVDPSGCIVRVDLAADTQAGQTVCPQTAQGVIAVAWLDARRIAYVTPESERIGWRYYDYATGGDGMLIPGEGPPAIHAGPVQPYSIFGELVEVDAVGTVTIRAGDTVRAIYSGPPSSNDLALPQLLTWSPDAQWIVLERSRQRALTIVSRDGSRVLDIADASRGLISWFMPAAGATPHMDFTCGLPSPEAYACSPLLRAAVPGPLGEDVLLTWQSCTGATGYEIEVTSAASGEVVVHEVVAATGYRLVPADIGSAAGGELRWRVRPFIGNDRAAWSGAGTIELRLLQEFTTD
ncbi:MAG: hypothetical protein AB7T37_00145 [Dehalococcoidia bacterium]